MGGGNKIKGITAGGAGKIGVSQDKTENIEIKHPVFCFKYINKKYGIDNCIAKEQEGFLKTLQNLSQKTWQEIHMADRHSFGTEKIAQSAIIGTTIPSHLSKDEILYAIRFHKKAPMVGYKSSFVFHILYLDRDFTLYKHS